MSKENKKQSQDSSGKRGHGLILAVIVIAFLVVVIVAGALTIGYLMLDLPDISSLKSYRPPVATTVVDQDMQPIAYWYEEKRWVVPRERIPDIVIKAFLAAEDARFYEHPGIDWTGVLRAMFKNFEAGGMVQGASTITQQLTRALLLTPEKSLERKIKEAILAWQIDSYLSKDEIITIYLNHIFFGQQAYGIEAASRTYFGKHVEELNLAEAAILAGLPQAPSRYNPFKHTEQTKKRQLYVLRRMVEEGFITSEDADIAARLPIVLRPENLNLPSGVEYFISEVRREMEAKYGQKRLLTEGFTIVTTLRRDWQQRAFDALQAGIDTVIKRHPKDAELAQNIQGAILAMELETGEIKALVGGRNFASSQFNYATQGRVQPGSSFKPIVYAAALEKRVIYPNSILVDEPITLGGSDRNHPWTPENFDNTYMGPVTVRTAITLSRNIISVKIASMLGYKEIHNMAARLGIESPLAPNLSIALGSTAIPLIELVQAYSNFPLLGKRFKPHFIKEIRDKDNRLLERYSPEAVVDTISPVTAYQMVNLLESVVQEGTGSAAKALKIPVAGKTGTTDNYKDALFVGFSPEVVAGVWIGREDQKSLGRLETGGHVSCPVWTSFMEITKPELKKKDFDMPPGVVLVAIDKNTGRILPESESGSREARWVAMNENDLPATTTAPGGEFDNIDEEGGATLPYAGSDTGPRTGAAKDNSLVKTPPANELLKLPSWSN